MAIVKVEKNRYTVDTLYQWDKDQVLEIYGLSLASIPEVHFTNAAMDGALVRQSTMNDAGVISVEVPNSVLQKPYKITVYVCTYENEAFKTLYSMVIPVEARSKPIDYTIEVTDEEVYSFNALENKIDNVLALSLERYEKANETLSASIDNYNEGINEVTLAKESAQTSAENAFNSAEEARVSSIGSANFANSASNSAKLATTKASEAQTSATNASASEENASASEENASASAEKASLSAELAVNAQSGAEVAKDKAYEYLEVTEDAMEEAVKAKQAIDKAILTYGQLNPLFANSVDECTDTDKLYVLPDGYIYAYMKNVSGGKVSNFGTESWSGFNALNTTENAYVFNHIGATLAGNLKSITAKCGVAGDTIVFAIAHVTDGVVISVDEISVTTKEGEQTYVNGVDFVYNGTVQVGDLIGYSRAVHCQIYYGTSAAEYCYKTTSLTDYTLTQKNYGFAIYATVETPSETGYAWKNTNHAFIPADYEDRIIDLENTVTEQREDIELLKENGIESPIVVTGTEINTDISNYADSESFVIRVKPSSTAVNLTMEKSEATNSSATRQICYVDFANGKIGFYTRSADNEDLTVFNEKALGFSIVAGHEFVVEMIKLNSKYATLRVTDAYTLESDKITCSEYVVGRGWGARKYTYDGSNSDIVSVKSYILQNKETKLLIVGDSFIEGSSLPQNGEDRDNRYAMLMKKALNGDCFINGRGGATSGNVLDWFNTYLSEVCSPKYTIVAVGCNDNNYDTWLARYQSIIAKIEEMDSKPILVTICANTAGGSASIFGNMNNWIKNSGYDYIDANLVTSLDYGMSAIDPDYFFSDGVHPNTLGNEIIFKRAKIDTPYLFVTQ